MQSDLNLAAQPTAEEWLDVCEPALKKTVISMFRACKEIAYKIRTASCDKMACFNEFGDEQLAIDILANNVIFQNLKASGSVATASSEETPTEDPMGLFLSSIMTIRFRFLFQFPFPSTNYYKFVFISYIGGKGYSVAFDPLDGSSVIDTNFAVGTIFGMFNLLFIYSTDSLYIDCKVDP